MTGPFDRLFEALMTAAERADDLFGRRRSRTGLLVFLALLAALLLIYALSPGPGVPMTPCPPDNITGIGLSPSLWWVGSGARTPPISKVGLDPNSEISYQVLLGAAGEEMQAVGTVRGGGGGSENLFVNTTAPLAPGTVYRWQVVAENAIGKRAEGDVWTFSTRSLPEIESFEADRSAVDLGEPVTLRWSVANAGEAEIEPGVGAVPLQGEMSLAPQENVTYTLTATNFAGTEQATVEVVVFKPLLIDSMAGGWSTIEDRGGSVVRVMESVLGVEDNATRISYDLVPNGWVGITKSFSAIDGNGSLNLAGTDGISFFARGGGAAIALELRLEDSSGTISKFTWDEMTASSDWKKLEAGYQEFGCKAADGSGCGERAFDLGNVTSVIVIISDRERREFGSSGWFSIDDLQAFHQRDGESGAEG